MMKILALANRVVLTELNAKIAEFEETDSVKKQRKKH